MFLSSLHFESVGILELANSYRMSTCRGFKVPRGSGGALPSDSDREPAASPAGTED